MTDCPNQEDKTEIQVVKRWFIEDGREMLKNALDKTVCVLIYGDPLLQQLITNS